MGLESMVRTLKCWLMLESDVRYSALVLAAAKAGYVARVSCCFPSSMQIKYLTNIRFS